MKKRKKSARKRLSDDALLGPPARETVWLRGDAERLTEEELRQYTSTGSRFTGGDLDADWRRADSVGEEARTVATPDQDVVDEIGKALGVPRAPDEEFRPSGEILEQRDRKHLEQED